MQSFSVKIWRAWGWPAPPVSWWWMSRPESAILTQPSVMPSLHMGQCPTRMDLAHLPANKGNITNLDGDVAKNRRNQLNQSTCRFLFTPDLTDRHLFQPKTLLKKKWLQPHVSPRTTTYENIIWLLVPKQDSNVLCNFGHVPSQVCGKIVGRGMTFSHKAMKRPPLSACAQMHSLFDEALTTPWKQARLKMDPSQTVCSWWSFPGLTQTHMLHGGEN